MQADAAGDSEGGWEESPEPPPKDVLLSGIPP